MTGIWILLGGVVIVVIIALRHSAGLKRRRNALRKMPLHDDDRRVIEASFPLWSIIPDETRRLTEGWIQVFLHEKAFEACGSLKQVTREMKLAVAAPACLLIAHRPDDYYERLKSILIYPNAYTGGSGGDQGVRLGESWSTGSVVLAWSSVRQGSADRRDGHHVVIHEFAHQIDQEDGVADGVPELETRMDYGRWSRAFAPAYEAFCERVEAGKRSVIDDYGATNAAEFFAVGTETFFEKAKAMKREEPEVYAELVRFYQMDPASWR